LKPLDAAMSKIRMDQQKYKFKWTNINLNELDFCMIPR
jgi:hypothetical protein